MSSELFSIVRTEKEFEPLIPGSPSFVEHIFSIPASDGSAAPEGELAVTFYPTDKSLSLTDINVRTGYDNQGRGKALLSEALSWARKMRVSIIVARPIVSRECLDAMSSVFGEEHIYVEIEGEYGQENTSAELVFPVTV